MASVTLEHPNGRPNRDGRLKPQHLEVLSGWKEIASYLGKGVRTAQRYEHELRLPVRRPAGKPRGSVLTTKSDLDNWVRSSALRNSLNLPPGGIDLHNSIERMKILFAETERLRTELLVSSQRLIGSIRMSASHVSDDFFAPPRELRAEARPWTDLKAKGRKTAEFCNAAWKPACEQFRRDSLSLSPFAQR
jgi:hypothetical protein